MKVIQITPSFFQALGGVETHVLETSKALIAAGHQVIVLTNGKNGDEAVSKHQNILILRNTDGSPILKTWSYKFSVWKWFWQQRTNWLTADVIQVHDVFWWVVPFLPLISHKIFTTFHGWETVYPVRLSAKIQRFIWSWLSVKTVHVGDWIREFYWDKPDAVTYGAPTSQGSLPKKATLQLRKVAFIGRLSPENEIEKYVQLFQSLKSIYPKLEIIWVGDGPLKSLCQKTGQVTGMVNKPEKYIEDADLVGASSYLAMWQAQAMGKLCLGFYSHDLKKRYLETYPGREGMIISNTANDMLDQLKRALKNKDQIATLHSTAHSTATSQSWQKVVNAYLELWKK